METKIIRRLFGLADFYDEQKFLEQQHAQGWKFVKFQGLIKYTFEKYECEEYIYQLDYKEDDKDDETYIQIFTDCGWEYIMKYQTWYYFRKAKSDISKQDNEIFSDRESKIAMIKKVMGRMLLVVGICLYFPIMFVMTSGTTFQDKDIAYICIMIFYAIFMLLLLSLSVSNIIKLNKLINEIEYPIDEE